MTEPQNPPMPPENPGYVPPQPGIPPQAPPPGYAPQGAPMPGAPGQSANPGVNLKALPAQTQYLLYGAAAAALVTIIGCFGPWATIKFLGTSKGVSGTSSNGGIITLLLALVAVAALGAFVFAKTNFNKHLPWVGLGASVLALLVCILNLADISGNSGEVLGSGISLGWGLIVAIIGTIGLGATSALLQKAIK